MHVSWKSQELMGKVFDSGYSPLFSAINSDTVVSEQLAARVCQS